MVLIAGIFARETIYDVPLQSFHTLSVRHWSQSSLPLRAPTVTEAVTDSAAKAAPTLADDGTVTPTASAASARRKGISLQYQGRSR